MWSFQRGGKKNTEMLLEKLWNIWSTDCPSLLNIPPCNATVSLGHDVALMLIVPNAPKGIVTVYNMIIVVSSDIKAIVCILYSDVPGFLKTCLF